MEENRAGIFIQQPSGYKSFIPKKLPPIPPIHMDSEMIGLLSKADRKLGRLDGVTQTLPNPELFVAMYVRKEAVLSSQIEGTQASLTDVLTEEKLKHGEVLDVVNYVNAMNYGLDRLDKLPLSLRLIKEIHAIPVRIYSKSASVYKNNKRIKEWSNGATIMFMPGKYILSDSGGNEQKIEVLNSPLEIYL